MKWGESGALVAGTRPGLGNNRASEPACMDERWGAGRRLNDTSGM